MKQRFYASLPARIGLADARRGSGNVEDIVFSHASRYTAVERKWIFRFWAVVLLFKLSLLAAVSMYVQSEVERKVAERLQQIKFTEYAIKN